MKNKALIGLFLLIIIFLLILIIYKNRFRNEAFMNSPGPYDNGKVYTLGDVVIHDDIIYIMKDGIGAAGYAPPRPNNWAPLPPVNLCTPVEYDNGKVYKVGDLVSKDAVIYVMIDGIGAAGYSPPRPTNWTPVSLDSIAAFCPVPAPPSVPMQAPPAVMQAPPAVMQAPPAVMQAPPAVMQAPARMKAGPARMKAAPVKSRFSAIGRIVKKEGFFDISNSLRSKMTKSLLFGPADFSSI